jgi:hypothetical protein
MTKVRLFLFISVLIFLGFGFSQRADAITKKVGQTATITVTCSDLDNNLTQCKVTSPCTQTCAASGGSGTCSCQYTCSSVANYDTCGYALDAAGYTNTRCVTGGLSCVTCITNSDCDDSNPATIDVCTAGNTCTHTQDVIAPIISAFTVNGISYPTTVNASTAVSIAWTASDSGVGINHYEVWRAPDSGGTPGSWSAINSGATSPITNNPGNGTWWYGVHAIDNASNCINEAGGHCGGAVSDSSDPRTVRGPIKVIYYVGPITTNLSTDVASASDYCGSAGNTPVRARWQFSGSGQSAYQIQASTTAGTLVWDSGKVMISANSAIIQNLTWNTQYNWRLKVWDLSDISSSWTSGPGVLTIAHPYPAPSFTWSPTSPPVDTVVDFTDTSVCYASGGCSSGSISYHWDFANGQTSGTKGNVSTVYSTTGPKNPSLTITDSSIGGVCIFPSSGFPVNFVIQGSSPQWQEVLPQ